MTSDDLVRGLFAVGLLDAADAVDYIRQAALGLAFAHGQGVIHRDVKPANLLLDKKGTVKVADMGLARLEDSLAAAGQRLTQAENVFGTVDFMAPEQATASCEADERSDIYSLGCSLYRLLTGENIYPGRTVAQIIMAHREQPVPDLRARCPSVSPQLDAVFHRMVAKRPADRYQTMAEVVAALDTVRAGRFAGDQNKTGSIFGPTKDVVAVRKSPVPPNQWFTLEVIAKDNWIEVKVNGQTTARYTDPKRSYPMGHLALQQYTDNTVVEFRKIEICELPSTNR